MNLITYIAAWKVAKFQETTTRFGVDKLMSCCCCWTCERERSCCNDCVTAQNSQQCVPFHNVEKYVVIDPKVQPAVLGWLQHLVWQSPRKALGIGLSLLPWYNQNKWFLILRTLQLSRSLLHWGFGLYCPDFEPRWMWEFPHSSRRILGPTQLPAQWIPCFPGGTNA
jgi:hypothetical protein